MRVYQKTIEYEKDGDKIKLVAFGDLHLGSSNCDLDMFRAMLRRHGKAKNTYLIDMGDACDFITPSDMKRFRLSGLDGRCKNDAVVDWQIDEYCSLIEQYVDRTRFLGLASGNHHDSILKNYSTDPTARIAKRLGVTNLGYCFYYRLLFKRPERGYETLIVYGNHGYGGSCRTEGGNLTKFSKNLSNYYADIFLYAHSHDKWAKRIIRIKPVLDKVKEVPMIVANTGTFLLTLSKNETPSYSEKAGYPPQDIGYVVIDITTPTDDNPFFDLRGKV